MANDILLYLNNKYENSPNSSEEILDKLIHMENTNTGENNIDGGVGMENIVENLTGGNSKGVNLEEETINNTPNKKIDSGLFEGGNISRENVLEYNNKNIPKTDNVEDNNLGENNNWNMSESDDNYCSDSEEEDELIEIKSENFKYEDFINKWKDKEPQQTPKIIGGNKNNKKLDIITVFPYLIR